MWKLNYSKGERPMAKKIEVGSIGLSVNGSPVTLDYEDEGYYLGSMDVAGVNFHVEAFPVKVTEKKRIVGGKYLGADVRVRAENPTYQDRIDNWENKNESCTPQLISFQDEGVKYFVHIEVYAA
jgi:hypothetical protein